jgi:hypothetical protein
MMDENPYRSGQAKSRLKEDQRPLVVAPILTVFMLFIVLPLVAMIVVLVEWWFGS